MLIRKKREMTGITNIRNQRGNMTIDSTYVRKEILGQYERPYDNKMVSLGEMDKFFGRHQLPKFTQEKINNLNNPMFIK